uniref:Uncharacterized protein n=1 Tax=Octopus bimaculoides TaxID=37653 RepID=A0A0L8GRB0_OCTBM
MRNLPHATHMSIHLNTRYMVHKQRYFITHILKMTVLITHMHIYCNTNIMCYFFQCKSKKQNFPCM